VCKDVKVHSIYLFDLFHNFFLLLELLITAKNVVNKMIHIKNRREKFCAAQLMFGLVRLEYIFYFRIGMVGGGGTLTCFFIFYAVR
jgi:hypothetical protein